MLGDLSAGRSRGSQVLVGKCVVFFEKAFMTEYPWGKFKDPRPLFLIVTRDGLCARSSDQRTKYCRTIVTRGRLCAILSDQRTRYCGTIVL